RVSLIGLRLGATLAARGAAKRAEDVSALVLWDPVVFGTEYLEQLFRTSTASQPAVQPTLAPSETGGSYAGGCLLRRRTAQEFRSINLPALIPALSTRTLIITTETLSSHEALRPLAVRHDTESLIVENTADPSPWIEDPLRVAAVAVNTVQRITQWLA